MSDEKSTSALIKAAGLGAMIGLLTGSSKGSSGPSSSKKPGCFGCLGILLVVGLFGMMLERIGCIATEKSLREQVQVTITGIRVQQDKKLAWVHFKVQNQSKWPISLGVSVEVFQTTKDQAVVRNSAQVLNVPPKSESGEQRVAFDLDELTRAGIVDPADRDRCSFRQKIEWICEAGEEPKQRPR